MKKKDWVDPKENPEAMAALKEAISYGDERRSPLYRWMWDNHDTFLQMLDDKRPNWARIAEVFSGLGFSAEGKKLRADTVRQTWWRVRARRAELFASSIRPKSKKKDAGSAPDISRPVSSASPSNPSGISPISPVSPASPVTPARPAAPIRPATKSGDPDEVRRKLDAQLNQGKVSMPDPIK